METIYVLNFFKKYFHSKNFSFVFYPYLLWQKIRNYFQKQENKSPL